MYIGSWQSLTSYSLLDMFAVIGRELFSAVDPKRFGSLAKALVTLFQLITLDDWFYMYTDIINVDPGTFRELAGFVFEAKMAEVEARLVGMP